jgi:hypothetical protein
LVAREAVGEDLVEGQLILAAGRIASMDLVHWRRSITKLRGSKKAMVAILPTVMSWCR